MLIAASSLGEFARSRLLFIHERNSGKRFMVDSVADVSAIPPNLADRHLHISGFTLQAVNRTSIKTYGQRAHDGAWHCPPVRQQVGFASPYGQTIKTRRLMALM